MQKKLINECPDGRYVYKVKHKLFGLCIECSEKAVKGRIRCAKHLLNDRNRNYQAKLQRREQGLCPICGNKLNVEIDGNNKCCYFCNRKEFKIRPISEGVRIATYFVQSSTK